jgi:hypothetical protein
MRAEISEIREIRGPAREGTTDGTDFTDKIMPAVPGLHTIKSDSINGLILDHVSELTLIRKKRKTYRRLLGMIFWRDRVRACASLAIACNGEIPKNRKMAKKSVEYFL